MTLGWLRTCKVRDIMTASTNTDKLTGKQLKTLRAFIDAQLSTRTDAVERAIITLNALQTADEQASRETKHNTCVGFNSSSAPFGTYVAGVIGRSTRPAGEKLYGEYLIRARKIALRHSGQLVAATVAKQGVEKALRIVNNFLAAAAQA